MNRLFGFFLLLATMIFAVQEVHGQARPKAKPRVTNTKGKPAPKKPATATKPAVTQPAKDTVAVAKVPEVEPEDSIPLKPILPTKRSNTTVQGNLTVDKTPLGYDHIRIDDQVYKQIIWREINVKEKMNLPFRYDADDDNGSQRFFNILLKHIRDGDITAFSNANDRFTTPLKASEVATMLLGKKYFLSVPNRALDPDLSKGIMKDSMIRDEFDENTIIAFRIKEEIIFDRETSRLHFRILGIAPVKAVKNDDGSFRDAYTLFWVYYPELRPYLAKYEAYNPRNMGMRMSWEEIFESRYFSSYIIKSTLNNPFDQSLASYMSDPLMRLLEGENIKETIFNWEQNQWSY